MESDLSVRDVLTNEFVGVSESDTVRDAVSLMREERASCVLVVRGPKPVGIMTEWDVLGIIADEYDAGETTVGDAMTAPVITFTPEQSLTEAANVMTRQHIRNIVVEDDDGVLGLVTQRDVIAAASSFQGTMTPLRSSDAAYDNGQLATERPAQSSQPREELESGSVLPNDEYSTQSVCEACGTLSDSLWDANGKLVCTDCRAV
ncbi:CBS domain-containing protein [Natronorubrum sediminis]|uniref:CBS domain-containing protein n=1 Tax=Natronorubrum sediminis TaxID=640943 RepID=A0A1H6FLB0_9EURY|nr:CBS domain-containing protein [Natronorubrum sediminis]SEH11162.1 CBS domain-containing protein [Natronorubrum sediminis]